MPETVRVGFLGSGGIARAHAYALDILKYYYVDAPSIEKAVVASPTPSSRQGFADRYGFKEAVPPEAIWDRDDLNTLYILGPNQTHTPQLLKAAALPHIQRIFVEKPIGTSVQDIRDLKALAKTDHGKTIVMGFQYLQKSPIRQALDHWRSGELGDPIHFRGEYLHSSYLDPVYRREHPDRLKPIPINGAAADLGSHVLSLLIAFLGEELLILSAAASKNFDDVPSSSDLCTTALIQDQKTGAVGTMVASRVSAGTGDRLSLEIRGTHGALIFSTDQPDSYQSFKQGSTWRKHETLSDYRPNSTFPSDYAPSGWLRALVHHHYLFLGGEPNISFVPGLIHGIRVQQLLQAIAAHILDY